MMDFAGKCDEFSVAARHNWAKATNPLHSKKEDAAISQLDRLRWDRDYYTSLLADLDAEIGVMETAEFWDIYQKTGRYEDMTRWLKHRAWCNGRD